MTGDPYQLTDFSGLKLLVFNCGSLSLRYRVFDGDTDGTGGEIEGLGGPGPAKHRHREETEQLGSLDHAGAMDRALDALARELDLGSLSAVGHRVLVQPDDVEASAALVDDALLERLRGGVIRPWDESGRIAALARCRQRLAGVPQVAVFDSAFFRTLPELARLYALPARFARDPSLMRIGFQGLSHKHAAFRAADELGRPLAQLKLVTAHLGSGASLAAVDHARAVDTTMGLTPLAGLVSGQRCGDMDPGLLCHLMAREGLKPAELLRLLDRESGLAGLSGRSGDVRELERAADDGDGRALAAIQVFCRQVAKQIAAMGAVLDGFDALVFTGGVGENAAGIRARICQGLGHLGLVLDESRNRRGLAERETACAVGHSASRIAVLCVRSDEARMIARETARALGRADLNLDPEQRRQQTPIPIGVSAHHVHLSQAHVEALFGPGRELTPHSPLKQPGQFAAEERVTLVGPKGEVPRVRVLGPVRAATQVEISRTEEFQLGIDAPIRDSGDLDGTPGLVLKGPAGSVTLEQGVICARRHIHMSPAEAEALGVRDRDVVMVEVGGERPLIFGDVLVRAKPTFTLEMHLDTDEANAGEISSGMSGRITGIQSRPARA
ncbi:MAG: phosphate propanoyltransferase [Deltaproteobacteria bacterium]|nr:phosphate propanoyltransferase [Deltaproteobacteria bacterium]